jgi:Predicted nucleic acid-binding protein, contains PIN domain
MLPDCNIIIYSALPDNEFLREFIQSNSPFVSEISRVEVLGFQKLTESNIEYFDYFFESTTLLQVSEEVITKAVALRQRRKMTLGDSLIAATAIVYGLTLVTSNIKDFRWVDDLGLVNPFEKAS